MSLYPNYKPIGIKRDWDHTSMELVGSGEVLRRHGVMADYGNPIDAVAWFDSDGDGALKVLVADYANGRRATLRKRSNGSSLEVVTPAKGH